MGAVDDHDPAVAKAGDDRHLPQRAPHIQRASEDAHHQASQLCALTRRGQHLTTDVLAEIEVGVVDPDRVREVERDAMDALAVARHEVDALADRLFDAGGAAAAWYSRAAFEHVD